MKLTVTVDVPDDLYEGECQRCPFGYWQEWETEDDGWDGDYQCCLGKCAIGERDDS